MKNGRSCIAKALPTLALLIASLCAQQARAGLFDDDEARRQIKDNAIKVNERLDTLSKGQLDLVNQINALRDENARLRGQVETLTYDLDDAKKRQQDFYVDLDSRLRKLEPQATAASQEAPATAAEGGAVTASQAPAKPASDPAAEAREYETALNYFKANKVKEAASAFAAFVKAHPDSQLAPSAQYWLGNAYYALQDCKRAIDAHRAVVAKWPQNSKAPDALLNVGMCQFELGDDKGARTTLNAVVAKYPSSAAAEQAKQRLKK